MERSIAQQDEEMAELEERIRKQRDILGQLRDVGLSIKREREQRERNGGADAMET